MKKVNKFYFINNLLSNIELCCPQCYYLNIHSGHKVLQIVDEELIKKEDITLDSSLKGFNEDIKKIISLKEKIENEINKIDKLYDKVMNEVTKSFEIKHEKLIKEENDLKEKLQIEVTKVKEKLENFLSESNNVIKTNEKLNKGIKNIEKDKEQNFIKTLSYISKINKNKKEILTLNFELMKNLNISFNEKENNIKYDEYLFNGILIPKDIEVKYNNADSIKLFWKLDDINITVLDKKEIKFRVEIKKEQDSNKEFLKVYEGTNKNCLIDKLINNASYEIRICSIYDDLPGPWSEIKKFIKVDSIILMESKNEKAFLETIYEWSGYKQMELIYRGTRDNIFHNKCDNKGPTICLYKNDKGNIFGGYASISWTNSGDGHSASDSFIFTLTNIHGTKPTKFCNIDTNNSVYHSSDIGPCFYDDIWVYNDFRSNEKNNSGYSSFPRGYKDTLSKGRSIFTGDFDNNNNYIKLTEVEVFKVYK